MSQKKLWLLKHTNGRIQGPLSTDEITRLIREKTVCGEESVSLYPEGKWKPVSAEPLFYEPLLSALSQTEQDPPEEESPSALKDRPSESKSTSKDSQIGQTVVADLSQLNFVRKRRKKKRRTGAGEKKKQARISAEKTIIFQPEEEQIEEAEESSPPPSARPFFLRSKAPVLALIALVFGFLFFVGEDKTSAHREYVELADPGKSENALAPQETELLIKKALIKYLNSQVPSYLQAQILLSQAISGSPKNTYAMALLCLVYLELWPFTKQDLKSVNTISKLTHQASILNRGGVQSGMCHSVSLITKGKYKEAKTMVESSLDGLSGSSHDKKSQELAPFFYYLKARILYYLKDYSTMMSYLDTIQRALSRWIAPYMLMAEVLIQQNKINQALSFYNKVITLNPGHKTAKIKKGLIEYKHFNKPAKAEKTLKIALAYPELISSQVLSEAYLALAKINLKREDSDSALKYARQAYKYNPAGKAGRNLVVQIGGLKKLKQTQAFSRPLVYKGDQLRLSGKFRSAIGYYEEAFAVDKGKNAVTAVKTAKTYWALSFSDQALSWLKKAINANAEMMEAYVLMAEYYSELYDFNKAENILRLAFRKAPASYELHRGKAYLSLKKGEYGKAVQSAKKALKIYTADVESYVILSKAYAKLGNTNEALASAARGLEMDPNAVKVQVAYARALGHLYGTETGINYFQKLVVNYPLIMEYRMEMIKYLFDDERYTQARQALVKVIEIEPKYNEAYFYLGRILMFEEDFKKAYEAFLQSALLNPSDPRPTFYIGLLRLKEKQFSLAEKQFMKVLALNSLYPKAHYYLGRIAFLQKNYEKAVKESRLESRSNPRLILPYLLVGEAYEKMKQFLNCAVEYQKAIELAPEEISFYVKTARCYRQSGHLDLAVKILKKAGGDDAPSGIKSGDPQLYKELGMIYEIRGAYQSASGSYCNYLNLFPRAPDRKDIENRMKKLAKRTGKKIKNCG